MEQRILLTECADRTGLIAAVTGACGDMGLNVVRQDQYASPEDRRFFMRSVLEGDFAAAEEALTQIRARLPPGAQVRLRDLRKRRLCVLVTREPHCLGELLMKCYAGTLPAEIVSVIGNHPDLHDLCAKFAVPFTCVPHTGLSRAEHERLVTAAVDAARPDYVILAKYMRVLSAETVAHYPLGRLINIHHSFLPAFMGAKPYQQAYDRGVKLIGATAHFVTDNLDEGPIIVQDVIRVNHRYDPVTLAKAGHDVEQMVLLRAVAKILDDKVFIHGNKTVVF